MFQKLKKKKKNNRKHVFWEAAPVLGEPSGGVERWARRSPSSSVSWPDALKCHSGSHEPLDLAPSDLLF